MQVFLSKTGRRGAGGGVELLTLGKGDFARESVHTPRFFLESDSGRDYAGVIECRNPRPVESSNDPKGHDTRRVLFRSSPF
jgi:hypothetical protein